MFSHFRKVVTATALFSALVVTGSSLAAPEKQVIDVAHSTLDFTATSFLIDAEGTFKDWQGEVVLDREDISKSSVSVTINPASIDTRIDKRNEHLKSPDFLDVAKFPTITFKSTKLVKTGDKAFTMTGDFTLHGVTKSITFPVTIDRLQDNYSRFRAATTLSRKAFGITYDSSMNPIGDELKVEMVINVKKPS